MMQNRRLLGWGSEFSLLYIIWNSRATTTKEEAFPRLLRCISHDWFMQTPRVASEVDYPIEESLSKNKIKITQTFFKWTNIVSFCVLCESRWRKFLAQYYRESLVTQMTILLDCGPPRPSCERVHVSFDLCTRFPPPSFFARLYNRWAAADALLTATHREIQIKMKRK